MIRIILFVSFGVVAINACGGGSSTPECTYKVCSSESYKEEWIPNIDFNNLEAGECRSQTKSPIHKYEEHTIKEKDCDSKNIYCETKELTWTQCRCMVIKITDSTWSEWYKMDEGDGCYMKRVMNQDYKRVYEIRNDKCPANKHVEPKYEKKKC